MNRLQATCLLCVAVSVVQIDIIKWQPAIVLCLWFVQLLAYTGNRDELDFLFLFIYILFRFTLNQDMYSNTLLILWEVLIVWLLVCNVFDW